MIATMLIVIALLLLLAEAVGRQEKDIKHLRLIDAIVEGFCTGPGPDAGRQPFGLDHHGRSSRK